MTGLDLILLSRGLSWNQERAASDFGIGWTSPVKYEDSVAVPRTVELATVALTLKAGWPVMKNMNQDRLLHLLKHEVMRVQDE